MSSEFLRLQSSPAPSSLSNHRRGCQRSIEQLQLSLNIISCRQTVLTINLSTQRYSFLLNSLGSHFIMEQVEKQLTITCKRALAKKVLRGLLFNIYLCEKIYLSRPLMDPTMSLESKIERIADWLEKPTQCWNPLEYSLTQSLSTQKQNILMFKMMQKMIQDIATCNQQPKKPTRSSRTLSAFTIFAELPFDLREHIWVNTLPGSRTVEVYRDYYRTKSLDIGKAGHQELSTIRQACKESNDIILSRYHRILTSTFRTSSQSGEPNVLFNPSRDKLFLNRILFEELPHRKPYCKSFPKYSSTSFEGYWFI